jgi:hypothetical protein
MNEEFTDSLNGGAAGAQATSGSSAPTDCKKKGQYTYRLLKMSRLKEGVM